MSILDYIKNRVEDRRNKRAEKKQNKAWEKEMEGLDPEGYSEAKGGQKRRADYEWDKYNNPTEHADTSEKENVSIIGNMGSISDGNYYEVEVDGVMKMFNWNEGPLAGKLDADPNSMPANDMYSPKKGAWRTENYDPDIINTLVNSKRQGVKGGLRYTEMTMDAIMHLLNTTHILDSHPLFSPMNDMWENHMDTRQWYRPEAGGRYGNKGKQGEAALNTLPPVKTIRRR